MQILAGVQLVRPVATFGHCVIKRETAAFALYQKKVAFGNHFIISFQYFINILVITVKAGWVFILFMKVH